MIITLAVVDTAAYFTGRHLGRTPMSSVISPKKTMEGLAGALAGGFLAGAVAGPLLAGIDPFSGGALGASLALLGQMGDLSVSMVKRACGVKDSGRLIPGHGGLLDRLDSYLLTAPFLYCIFRYVLTP